MPEDNKQPWLIEAAIKPKRKADRERLLAALAQLAAEDPAVGVVTLSLGRASFTMAYDHYAPVLSPDDDLPPAAAIRA